MEIARVNDTAVLGPADERSGEGIKDGRRDGTVGIGGRGDANTVLIRGVSVPGGEKPSRITVSEKVWEIGEERRKQT